MTSFILALLLAAAEPSGQAGTATAQPPVAVKASQPVNDPNKMVCKVTENAGSRIQGRTCKTQAQWDAAEEELRHLFNDVRAKGTLTNNNPGASGH